MQNIENSKWCLSFIGYISGKPMISEEQLRKRCKYEGRSQFQRDCIDEYILGRLDVRNNLEKPSWIE